MAYHNDALLGLVNELELNDLRIQVMNEQIEGYWVKFDDRRIDIMKDGSLSDWPKGFFDLFEKQLFTLAGWAPKT